MQENKNSSDDYHVVVNDKRYYMEKKHKEQLDKLKDLILKDWDMVFIYDGKEGSGKSVKCMQDAYYCDPTLTLDRVTFTPQDFLEACRKADKYQAVIFDEAFRGLMSRNAMTKWNKEIVETLAEIRQKNLFIFIVMPTYFDLDRNPALWRTVALIHVYPKPGTRERGRFVVYNEEAKKDLYVKGKKTYNYKAHDYSYHGWFPNFYVLDESAYRYKKQKSLMREDKRKDPDEKLNEYKKELFKRLLGIEGMKEKHKAEAMGWTAIYWSHKKKSYYDNEQHK